MYRNIELDTRYLTYHIERVLPSNPLHSLAFMLILSEKSQRIGDLSFTGVGIDGFRSNKSVSRTSPLFPADCFAERSFLSQPGHSQNLADTVKYYL